MEEVKITINLEDKGADAGLKRLVQDAERMSAAAKAVSIDMSDLEGSIKSLGEKSKAATGVFVEHIKHIGGLKKELDQLASSGADVDKLLAKTRELAEAEEVATRTGGAALKISQKYWTALGLAGKDISEVQKQHTALVASYTEMRDRSNSTQAKVTEYTQKLKALEQQLDKTDEKTKKTGNDTDDLGKKTKETSQNIDGLSKNLDKVPGPLGEAARGMKMLTKETLLFLATPLGMTLAAISAALAAVSSWFHRTEEGEEALNVMTASFNGTLNTLLDVVDDVGEWLYKAFTKPGEALDELWHNLKDKLLADMKRVGEMGAGIVKIFSGDVSAGIGQMASAWNGIGMGSLRQRARQNAESMAEIGRRQNALDKEQRDWIVEREKKEARISELRAKIFDSTVKEADKAKAVAEAKKLTNQLYSKEQSMAKKQYEIIRDTNALSHSSIADKTKENEALAQTIRLEGQRNDALRTLNRTESSLANKGASAARKEAKEAAEADKRHAQAIEEERRWQAEISELVLESERAREDARIASIQDSAERERAEQAAQHRRRLEDIKRQAEEMQKAIYEHNKKVWETQHKGQHYETDSPEGAAGWSNLALPNEQQSIITAQIAKEEEEYKRMLTSRARDDRQYLNNYIKEYGSIQDKRAAVTREYDQKIADTSNAVQKAALEAQKRQALEDLNFKEWQQSLDWEAVFNDLQSQSTKSLDELKKKLREALTAGDVSAENAKVLAEKIREIEDLMSQRKDPFAAWLPGLRERMRLTNQVKEAEDQVTVAMQKSLKLTVQSNKDLQKLQQNIKLNTGKTVGVGEIAKMTSADYLKLLNLDPLTEAGRKAADEFDGLMTSTVDLRKSQEELTAAQKNAKTREAALQTFVKGGSIGQYFKDITNGLDFGQWANLINQNVQSMGNLVDKIGLGNSSFGEAVHDFADGVGGFNSAIQSLASGDVFGFVGGVVDGILSFGSMFGIGGGNEKEVERTINRLNSRNEILTDSIDRLNGTMEKANTQQSIENYQRIVEYQKEKEGNILKQLQEQMGYHSAHHSFNYYWDGVSQQELARVNANLRDTEKWSGDLAQLTAKQAQALLKDSNLVQRIANTGKGGYGERVLEYIKSLAEEADVLDELTDSLLTKLSGVSFDDMYSSFKSSLMDMSKSAEDWANDFEGYIRNAIYNALMEETLKEPLENWRKALAYFQKTGGKLEQWEIDALMGNGKGWFYDPDISPERVEWQGFGAISQLGQDARTAAEAFGLFNGAAEQTNELVSSLADSVKSSFSDLLGDPTQDVEEWGRNLKNSLIKQFVETQLLGEDFQEWAKEWSIKWQTLWTQLDSGEITQAEFDKTMAELNKGFDDMVNSTSGKAKKWYETMGYVPDAVSGAFSGLRDTFLSTLTDMEGDAESFRKSLEQTMVKDWIEKHVLDVPITVNGMSFENFNAYVSDWNTRYAEAVKSGNQEAIDALLDELVKVRALTLEAAEEFRKRLQTDDTTFSGMTDSFVSALMDMSKSAEDWSEEVGRTMAQKIIKEMLVSTYIQPYLDNIQKALNAAMKQEGATPDSVVAAVQPAIEEMTKAYPELQEIVKKIMDLLHLDTNPNADKTFSGMADSWVSTLMDMSKTAEDWAQSIGQTMAEKIIKEMIVTSTIQPLLDELQSVFSEAMTPGEDGKINVASVLEKVKPVMDEIIAKYPELQEVVKGVMEALGLDTLTTTGFDNLRSNFLDNLMAMEKDADKFGKQIGAKMYEQMAEQYVGSQYGKQIDALNQRWREALEAGDTEAMGNIRKAIEELYKTMADDEQIRQFAQNIKDATAEADTTFSDLTSAWVSSLMDFNATAEDWAKELGKMIAQKIIETTVVGQMLQPLLDNLQNAVSGALTAYGDDYKALMGDQGIAGAMQSITDAYPQLKETVEQIMNAFGLFADPAENPFKDLSSTLISSLTDMEATAKDFGKQIGQTLINQMIQAIIEKKGFQSQIEALGDDWALALESGDVAAIERVKLQLVALRREMGEAVQPLLDDLRLLNKEVDTTFSSMTDSWVSALMDMDGTAEQWAENVGKTMAQKIITQMIAPKFIQPLLDEMQEVYDVVMNAPGATIASVTAAMVPYIDKIKAKYEELQPIIEGIFGGFGIYRETVEEIAEEVEYALGDMKSDFVSALMDINNTADDFSKTIGKTMAQNFIENFVLGDAFDAKMKQWQQQYESIIGSGMSEDERKKQLRALRDSIAEAKEGYKSAAASVLDLFGVTGEDSQDATMNMADKITYDQADQLLGINLAQELTLEQILATLRGSAVLPSVPASVLTGASSGQDRSDEQGKIILAYMQTLADVTRAGSEELSAQMAEANSHLSMIHSFSKKICDEVVLHLGSMDSKLGHLKNL